jgi:hypothetical protein
MTFGKPVIPTDIKKDSSFSLESIKSDIILRSNKFIFKKIYIYIKVRKYIEQVISNPGFIPSQA